MVCGLCSMTPREEAQKEAEKTFKAFMDYFKRIVIVCIITLIFIGLVSDWKTPTNYNGEVYSPSGLSDEN